MAKNVPLIVKKAFHLAKAMHVGQVDKAGKDYFENHILPVVARVQDVTKDPDTIAAAYLHDIVEDTAVSLGDLLKFFSGTYGGTHKVAPIVATLTRQGDQSYFDYIRSIKKSGFVEAVTIKTADLKQNLSTPENIPASLVERYTKALEILGDNDGN